MKVARFSLPLSVILVIGLNQSTQAGPQSLLDPYCTIKAPVRKTAAKSAAPAREIPTSVTVGEGPAQVSSATAATSKVGNGGGILGGTKNVFSGIAAATKGAGANIASGTKKVGSSVASGAKNSGGFIAKGASSFGDKMSVVPQKMGDGLKATGEKIKDGSSAVGHALAGAPKAIGIGKDKPAPTSAAADKPSVGGRLASMPKAFGRGVMGAAAKTGEATKKAAATPMGFFGKLNPFKHDEAPVQTAAKETPIR